MGPAETDRADRTIRVLVVDSDRRVRQSLCGLIDLADGMEIAGAAADATSALAGLADGPVDLVLLDPRLPEFEHGKALVGAIAHGWPETAIVALYWPDDRDASERRTVTVVPSSVQPDSLVDLLRTSAADHSPDRAGGLS
jgi:DNA-binding NarL/FixJ family response regulator